MQSRAIILLLALLGCVGFFSIINEQKYLANLLRDPSYLLSPDLVDNSFESDANDINSNTANNASIDISDTFSCSSSFSASQLWQRYLPKIIAASVNMDVPGHLQGSSQEAQLGKIHSLLTDILPPSQLRKAVRNLPSSQYETIEHIIEKFQKRILDPDHNAPVLIAVFGGSVTLGRECYPGKKVRRARLTEPTCNWPHRLELLINTLFENEVVKVINLATGGTGTATGTRMVKYWMYPKDLKESGPDIIINAYSTNDGIGAGGRSGIDGVRDSMQNFVRAAIESKPCATPPLVVCVDDYLGNAKGANDNVLKELNYAMVLEQVAKWYDTVAISYAEVVRNIVYKDITNKTFHKHGNVHFEHLAHQTVAWSVVFAFLEMFENHCDDKQRELFIAETRDKRQEHNRSAVPILPPPLTNDLTLTKIASVWKASESGLYQDSFGVDCIGMNSTDQDPCIVAWIVQRGLFGSNELNNFMRQHIISKSGGWGIESNADDGWSNKVGFAATTPDASFTLEFKDIAKDLNVVTIFFMRSYGEKWKDSKARFTVTSSNHKNSTLAQHDIDGVHEMEYSLTLIERIKLTNSVEKGDTIKLKVDMISGNAFKIMGMTLCRF
eukprot:scaffold323_cov251-Chaetoceros_neogracile.AAC.3